MKNTINLWLLVLFIFQCHSNCFIAVATEKIPGSPPIISFCTGYMFGCAAFNTNKIKCWGRDKSWGGAKVVHYTELGDQLNEIGDDLPYISISNGTSLIEKIYCGGEHLCVKFSSSVLKCVGRNSQGRLGLGMSADYVGEGTGAAGDDAPSVNLGEDILALDVALGSSHSCVKVTGNRVKCFGSATIGELGYGDTTERGTSALQMGDNLPFLDFGVDAEVDSLHTSQSSSHSCVILSKPVESTQRIKCWGMNHNFQLGYGDQITRGDNSGEMGDSLPILDLGTESRVKQLALGWVHSCALLINDKLKCWGYAGEGQLGSASSNIISATGDLLPFVPIDSGKIVKSVSVSQDHTCILYTDDITVKCVGKNSYGLLGQGDAQERGNTPETTFPNISAIDLGTGNTKIVAIYASAYNNCIMLENNLTKCWGFNKNGFLLIGTDENMGDEPNEMGVNLPYTQLFTPTKSPTNSPTLPTHSPSATPTKAPTTLLPSRAPSTAVPSKAPVTAAPTNLTKKPTTSAPVESPTKNVGFRKTNSSFISFVSCFMILAILIAI